MLIEEEIEGIEGIEGNENNKSNVLYVFADTRVLTTAYKLMLSTHRRVAHVTFAQYLSRQLYQYRYITCIFVVFNI
jgi:predicted ATPase